MQQKYKSLIGVLAIVGVGVGGLAGTATYGSERYCRPVVPEIMVTFLGERLWILDGELLVMYFENAPEPFTDQGNRPSPRWSFGRPSAEQFVGQRARYEIRWETDRFQGLEVRGNDAFGLSNAGKNRVIGNLRWEGQSYPHRIEVSCDVSDQNPDTACEITRLIEDYADYVDEFGASRSSASSHDQCSPDLL
ncbi:MAG: hypothetical protein AAFN04_13290 [Pseudomonadota bacterium]